MGCSKSRPGEESDIPAIDITTLDRYNRFEHTLPFYRTRVEVFETKVKGAAGGKPSVSIAQLREAFKSDLKWADLQSDSSILSKILLSDLFEEEGEIGV
jgi:hypothetical protein